MPKRSPPLKVLKLLCAVALLITGAAKLFAASGVSRGLELPDPLLPLSNRQAFLLVGQVEVAVVAFLIWGRDLRLQATAVAWLASCFTAYRLFMWAGHHRRSCGCLGNLNEWLPWIGKHQDAIGAVLLLFLLACSYGFLIWDRVCSQKPDESRNLQASKL